jgi:hypothetical protein
MTFDRSIAPWPTIALILGAIGLARAQPAPATIELVLQCGTPLRVALHDRVRMKEPGQPVAGTLVEAVYSYDRMVLPAGTRVLGQVARFDSVRGRARAGAMLNGDFTPLRRAIVEFDSLVLDDGQEMALHTEVRSATEHLVLSTREPPRRNLTEQAADQVTAKAKETLVAVKKPNKLERLKQGLVMSLPYHPQYLSAGTVYTAVLLSPLHFGIAEAAEPAPPGARPTPESVLHARLLTPLSSAKTPRGTEVRAMVTEPVFSEDRKLILPEGAVLIGEVTFAKPARKLHRSGQLRFLFETVQAPERSPETLRASLLSVQAGSDQRLAIDDEGGASAVESKSRFVAPALASLALAGAMHQHVDYDTDGLGPETHYGRLGSRGVAGFFGWGLVGALLSQVSHSLSAALGILGVARTVVPSVFGKGRDVAFPADTAIEVELAAESGQSP